MTTGTGSFSSAKQRTDTIAAALRDLARLIGEPHEEAIELESGGQLVPGLGMTNDAADLMRRARDIDQGVFKLLVLGEFKNGKSTLLNSMLGSKVLPAKVTPATAIITVLVNGESKDVAVYETDNDQPRRLSWEDFNAEFKLSKNDIETLDKTGFLDRFQNIEYAQIESQHPFCANGVRLIDSPGLGEQASRTRVTTNFLKQAHAVLFVLNATRILSENEKKFVTTRLGKGRLNNVFFVINRVNQIEPSDLQDVQNWVQSVLKPHFLDDSGNFDPDFYARRVFYVNALGALEARLSETVDTEKLSGSGVAALEGELEKFLTSDEKLDAVLASSVGIIEDVVSEADRRIESQKSTLDQPLADLENRRAEAERKLKTLEQKKDDINRAILLFGNVIKERIYSNLREFLGKMRDNWPNEGSAYIKFDEVTSLLDVLQSFVNKEAEQKVAGALEVQVKKYLREKLAEWSEQLPAAIQDDVAKMMQELELQVGEFQAELDQIGELFAGLKADDFVEPDAKRANRLLQMALNMGDFGSAASGKFNLTIEDWSGFLTKLIQQSLLLIVTFGILGGPLGWILFLVIESWLFITQRERFKQRLLEKLGERLYTEVEKELPAKQAEIYGLVDKRFTGLAQQVTTTLQTQVNEKRAEIERILRQKNDTSFSIDKEKARLDSLRAKIGELSGAISNK
jgi:GTPase SAR1 family protein